MTEKKTMECASGREGETKQGTLAKWRWRVMNAVETNEVIWLKRLQEREEKDTLDFCIAYQSPLGTASLKGHTEISRILLEEGATVDFFDNHGCTPLMRAAAAGNLDTCRLLVQHSADVNKQNEWSGNSAFPKLTTLHYAVTNDKHETTTFLLENGAQIVFNPASPRTRTSLIADAIDAQNPRILELLLCHVIKQYHNRLHILPIHTIFDKAVTSGNEECCIVVLYLGCYPVWPGAGSIVNQPYISFFEKAANRGFQHVMNLMLFLIPQLMQEEWLVKEQYPRDLIKHPNFVSWLAEARKQPSPLTQLCKSAILAQLGNCY